MNYKNSINLKFFLGFIVLFLLAGFLSYRHFFSDAAKIKKCVILLRNTNIFMKQSPDKLHKADECMIFLQTLTPEQKKIAHQLFPEEFPEYKKKSTPHKDETLPKKEAPKRPEITFDNFLD